LNLRFLFGQRGGAPNHAVRREVLQLLSNLVAFASEPSNSESLARARKYYFPKVGEIYEDDPDFDHRMNNFLEWFIFDYKDDGGKAPTIFEKYIDAKRDTLTNDELVFSMTVGKHVHSIFVINYCRNGFIKANDMLSRKRFLITGDDNLEKGDLLESRIAVTEKGSFFSRTYCLHPKAAYKNIMGELKKRSKTGLDADFFLALQAIQLKWRRSRRINAGDIYRFHA